MLKQILSFLGRWREKSNIQGTASEQGRSGHNIVTVSSQYIDSDSRTPSCLARHPREIKGKH